MRSRLSLATCVKPSRTLPSNCSSLLGAINKPLGGAGGGVVSAAGAVLLPPPPQPAVITAVTAIVAINNRVGIGGTFLVCVTIIIASFIEFTKTKWVRAASYDFWLLIRWLSQWKCRNGVPQRGVAISCSRGLSHRVIAMEASAPMGGVMLE